MAKVGPEAPKPVPKTPTRVPPSEVPRSGLTPVTVGSTLYVKAPGSRASPLAFVTRMSAGASDSLFVRNAGIPVLGVAGWFRYPEDNRAHGLNERIAIKDFHEGVEFWYRLLKRVAVPS